MSRTILIEKLEDVKPGDMVTVASNYTSASDDVHTAAITGKAWMRAGGRLSVGGFVFRGADGTQYGGRPFMFAYREVPDIEEPTTFGEPTSLGTVVRCADGAVAVRTPDSDFTAWRVRTRDGARRWESWAEVFRRDPIEITSEQATQRTTG